jgi:hypothetical protein
MVVMGGANQWLAGLRGAHIGVNKRKGKPSVQPLQLFSIDCLPVDGEFACFWLQQRDRTPLRACRCGKALRGRGL